MPKWYNHKPPLLKVKENKNKKRKASINKPHKTKKQKKSPQFVHREREREREYDLFPCLWQLQQSLTDCDMILSMTIWEVSDEANEKGFPETVAASSNSPAKSSIIAPLPFTLTTPLEVLQSTICGGGARALDTSRAETLHDLDRNSMGSRGVSGGRYRPEWTGSGLQDSGMALSMRAEALFFVWLMVVLC